MIDVVLIILILIIPAFAQGLVTNAYGTYKNVKSIKGLSGQEVARKILDKYNLEKIHIVETAGELSDHYDPSRKVVRLSKDIFHGNSIAAISVAAHEVGHAIQDAENNVYMKVRAFIFPYVNISTMISYPIILVGLLMEAMDLIYVGIALTAVGLLFQIITLPVEFDASEKAKKELESLIKIPDDEKAGVKKMLNAAAMTYVAGVITSILSIIRLIINLRSEE